MFSLNIWLIKSIPLNPLHLNEANSSDTETYFGVGVGEGVASSDLSISNGKALFCENLQNFQHTSYL